LFSFWLYWCECEKIYCVSWRICWPCWIRNSLRWPWEGFYWPILVWRKAKNEKDHHF
jgi:hypothetical protein